ncbi:hypothetical protein EK904_003783 [Melospiza melodia maxima]|nr:hypothetical protein EK904_003783 [Melospiza melodia maxima]
MGTLCSRTSQFFHKSCCHASPKSLKRLLCPYLSVSFAAWLKLCSDAAVTFPVTLCMADTFACFSFGVGTQQNGKAD